MPTLTVKLDANLHLRLRHLSVDRRESLQKIVERLVREYVERETRTPSRRKEAKRKR